MHFEIKVDFKRQLKIFKGVDCLCEDLIPLLLIRCFHEIAILADQLNKILLSKS